MSKLPNPGTTDSTTTVEYPSGRKKVVRGTSAGMKTAGDSTNQLQ